MLMRNEKEGDGRRRKEKEGKGRRRKNMLSLSKNITPIGSAASICILGNKNNM